MIDRKLKTEPLDLSILSSWPVRRPDDSCIQLTRKLRSDVTGGRLRCAIAGSRLGHATHSPSCQHYLRGCEVMSKRRLAVALLALCEIFTIL